MHDALDPRSRFLAGEPAHGGAGAVPGRAAPTGATPPAAPGRSPRAAGPDAESAVHTAAHRAVQGAGGALPHLDVIQRAFGRHDVRGIRAHSDASAVEGTRALGAAGLAMGDRVAFAGAPDLHLAAHEAAHVVQQRRGVQLKAGVGEVGDAHEQHADAVADLVVQGKSAESLLDRYAAAGGATAAPAAGVQRKVVTTADPERDPMTAGSVPMAVKVAGGPVAQYAPGTDFHGHPTVVYMGHGNPDGTLVGANVDALVDDVAHPKRGMSRGSTLHLWTCYGARPGSAAPSLVERVKQALERSEIDGVTVTGVPNACITDPHSETVFSGVDEKLGAENAVVDQVLGHAWVECGLFEQRKLLLLPGHTLKVPAPRSQPPASFDAALELLVKHGKQKASVLTMKPEEKKQLIVATMRECNRIFFEHPLIQELVKRGAIQSAPAALTVMESTVLTDPIERRDPAYTEYMNERRDHGGEEF